MLPRPQVIDRTLICWMWSIASSPWQKKGKREGVLQQNDSCPGLDSAWSWSKVRPLSHHGPNIPNSLPIHLSWRLKQLTSLCHFPQMFPKLPNAFWEASACDFVTFASPYVTNVTLPSKPKLCWQKSKECSRLLGNRRDPLKHPQCSMSFHIFYVLL